eukprot:7569720-Lingulodinium_polyedra.AAC.1
MSRPQGPWRRLGGRGCKRASRAARASPSRPRPAQQRGAASHQTPAASQPRPMPRKTKRVQCR